MIRYLLGFMLLTAPVLASESVHGRADAARADAARQEANRKDVEARFRHEKETATRDATWRLHDQTNRPMPAHPDGADTTQRTDKVNREGMTPDTAKAQGEIDANKNRPNARDPKAYQNDGRSNTERLPRVDEAGKRTTYTEHTVNPRGEGGLDGKRIITGSDGRSYYTTDHMRTFDRSK